MDILFQEDSVNLINILITAHNTQIWFKTNAQNVIKTLYFSNKLINAPK